MLYNSIKRWCHKIQVVPLFPWWIDLALKKTFWLNVRILFDFFVSQNFERFAATKGNTFQKGNSLESETKPDELIPAHISYKPSSHAACLNTHKISQIFKQGRQKRIMDKNFPNQVYQWYWMIWYFVAIMYESCNVFAAQKIYVYVRDGR